MPSSVNVGARPMSARNRAYSSGLRPWLATRASVISGSAPLKISESSVTLDSLRYRRRRPGAMGAKRVGAVLSHAKAATLFQLGFVMAGFGGVLAEPIAAFVAAGNR